MRLFFVERFASILFGFEFSGDSSLVDGLGQWPQAAASSRLCMPSDLTTRRLGAGSGALAISCVSTVICDVGCGPASTSPS